MRRKCDVKKSLVPMLDRLSIIWDWWLLKTNYVRGITCMPKLRQTLMYNSDDILFYNEPFVLLLGINLKKNTNLILKSVWFHWCVNKLTNEVLVWSFLNRKIESKTLKA